MKKIKKDKKKKKGKHHRRHSVATDEEKGTEEEEEDDEKDEKYDYIEPVDAKIRTKVGSVKSILGNNKDDEDKKDIDDNDEIFIPASKFPNRVPEEGEYVCVTVNIING